VNYGTALGPYLATTCLQELAEDEEHVPLVSKLPIKDFYVGDIFTSTDSSE
jgi:hypothetical protein